MGYADFAAEDTAVPAVVEQIAAGRPAAPAWRNELGGLTFEVAGAHGDRLFVKWSPRSSGIDLGREAARLRWLSGFPVTVPPLVDHGGDEDATWLVTRALDGENAVAPRWKADPATATRVIGEGLRAFHEALPVEACPFSWSLADRLAYVEERASAGTLTERGVHDDFASLSDADLLAVVRDPPPPDRLVVCHGDTCAPNVLLTAGGRFAGHVDLGSVGVADRWADLAIATWSTTWNYGPGWERAVLDAYGVEPDPERTRYYRVLWDLGP